MSWKKQFILPGYRPPRSLPWHTTLGWSHHLTKTQLPHPQNWDNVWQLTKADGWMRSSLEVTFGFINPYVSESSKVCGYFQSLDPYAWAVTCPVPHKRAALVEYKEVHLTENWESLGQMGEETGSPEGVHMNWIMNQLYVIVLWNIHVSKIKSPSQAPPCVKTKRVALGFPTWRTMQRISWALFL